MGAEPTLHLSADGARALLLAAQGLLLPPARPATKGDALALIQRMGALQIDTIHVVARSPYFVLWSRLGAYDPAWLDELLREGALFEYWSHAASFLPIDDYPLYRRLMLDRVKGRSSAADWVVEQADVAAAMLAHIAANGPVRSVDFARADGAPRGWWNWKPDKRTLEHLHSVGDLMIARRERFQRVYDLRERVLPAWNDAVAPPLAEVIPALTLKAVRALGVATAAWLPDYFRLPKRSVVAAVNELVAAGALVPVAVEGWPALAYAHADDRALVEAAAGGSLRPERTTLLTPFDPIVWDRRRCQATFGFDYLLECYVPAAKRRFGYFTLAILRRGALVGRLDAKAHRKAGVFEVIGLFLEPGVALSEELAADLALALHECAAWHGTPEVAVRRSEPPALAALLSAALAR